MSEPNPGSEIADVVVWGLLTAVALMMCLTYPDPSPTPKSRARYYAISAALSLSTAALQWWTYGATSPFVAFAVIGGTVGAAVYFTPLPEEAYDNPY